MRSETSIHIVIQYNEIHCIHAPSSAKNVKKTDLEKASNAIENLLKCLWKFDAKMDEQEGENRKVKVDPQNVLFFNIKRSGTRQGSAGEPLRLFFRCGPRKKHERWDTQGGGGVICPGAVHRPATSLALKRGGG